jgi:16S rRNA (adenine1518-N6/adenine1519-N6)-dimethyltransferase
MFKIIRKAFSQRRKKVLNSLSHGKFLSLEKENWKEVLNDCGIDISSRAEDLSLYDYARISDRLE